MFFTINKYHISVFQGQEVTELSKVDRVTKAKHMFSQAMELGFKMHPDLGNVEIVYDRRLGRSYVRAIKDFAEGTLVLVPCGPLVKARTIKYGQEVLVNESHVMDAEDGELILVAPSLKIFSEQTVSFSPY